MGCAIYYWSVRSGSNNLKGHWVLFFNHISHKESYEEENAWCLEFRASWFVLFSLNKLTRLLYCSLADLMLACSKLKLVLTWIIMPNKLWWSMLQKRKVRLKCWHWHKVYILEREKNHTQFSFLSSSAILELVWKTQKIEMDVNFHGYFTQCHHSYWLFSNLSHSVPFITQHKKEKSNIINLHLMADAILFIHIYFSSIRISWNSIH